MHNFDENALSEFLAPKVQPRDVDALFPLLQSANVIQALMHSSQLKGEQEGYL